MKLALKYQNPASGINYVNGVDMSTAPALLSAVKDWAKENIVTPVARFIDSRDPTSPNYAGNIPDEQRRQNAERRTRQMTNPTYGDIISKGLGDGFGAGLFYEGFNPIYNREALGTRTYIKPWYSDPSKSNEATSVFLKNDPKNYFEVVKDMEPGYYSVHFKTQRGLPEWQKARLFQGLVDQLPEGAKVSTWGTVSPGGFSGLKRLQHQFGLKPSGEFRLVGMEVPEKPPVFGQQVGRDHAAIPILQKTTEPIMPQRTVGVVQGYPEAVSGGEPFMTLVDKYEQDLWKALHNVEPHVLVSGYTGNDDYMELLAKQLKAHQQPELRQHLIAQGRKPFYIGNTGSPDAAGLYFYDTNQSIVDSPKFSTILHERAAHPTEQIIRQAGLQGSYEKFLDALTNSSKTSESWVQRVLDDTFADVKWQDWRELRATLAELKGRALKKTTPDKTYESLIDGLTTQQIAKLLDSTNGYGQIYSFIMRNTSPEQQAKLAEQFKKLMYTPVVAAPILGASNLGDTRQNYVEQ